MKYVNVFGYVVALLIILISATEIYSYLSYPNDYHLESEAMIGNSGLVYSNVSYFLSYNFAQIILSAVVIFLLARSKTVKAAFIAWALLIFQCVVLLVL
jgi:hypothetical protein